MSDSSEFVDYVSSLKQKENIDAAREASKHAHEIWKTTTISGKLFSMVDSLRSHEFFALIVDAFRDQNEGNSPNAIFLYNIVRLVVIFMAFAVLHVIGRIIQTLIGAEYEVVEEIIIEEDEAPMKRRSKTNKED